MNSQESTYLTAVLKEIGCLGNKDCSLNNFNFVGFECPLASSVNATAPISCNSQGRVLNLYVGRGTIKFCVESTYRVCSFCSSRNLHDQNLAGQLGSSLGNLASLTHLRISGNAKLKGINGNLPTSLMFLNAAICDLDRLPARLPTSLTHLAVHYNRISGALPLPLPQKLATLLVYANVLSGTVPQMPTTMRFCKLYV
jgi:hypothetical protein